MALEDVTILVGVKGGEKLRASFRLMRDVIAEAGEQMRAAAKDFEEFEERAISVGSTIEAVSGITSQAVQSMHDFSRAQDTLGRELSRFRIEFLSPVVKEWAELVNNMSMPITGSNILASLSSIGRQAGNLGITALNRLTFLPHLMGGEIGLFDVGRSGRTVSREEAEARESARDSALALQRTRLQEQLTGIAESLTPREAAIRSRGTARLQSLAAGREQRDLFQSMDRGLFNRFQAIDRREFLSEQRRRQDFADQSLTPFHIQEQREREQLRQFDQRQKVSAEKRDLSDEVQANKATIRMEKLMRDTLANAKRQLDALRKIEQRRIESATQSFEEEVQSINNGQF